MAKRHLSPGIQPPPKRQHNDHNPTATQLALRTSFDQLWDEIVLVIFSYLSYKDLCKVQATNQNWSRLALDNQLWKKLYLGEYGRARLRGGRGFVGRQDGREIKPLPQRARHSPDEDDRDWKWMFRISSNWRTGRCTVEQWNPQYPPSIASVEEVAQHNNCIILAGSLTVASTSHNGHPALSLISPDWTKVTLSCKTPRSNDTTVITSIVLDQSLPTNAHTVRLAAFLSTSEFLVFTIDHHHPARSTILLSYLPTTQVTSLTNIFHAVFHENLVVTLSHSFHLSIYDLSSGAIVHSKTFYSFSSYPPSSLVLTPLPSTPHPSSLFRSRTSRATSTYKLIIAYAVPIYPAHWGIGATELIIASELSTMTVTSTRAVRAFAAATGWWDDAKFVAMRAQWERKVERVADIQTDGKWVVLAPGEKLPGQTRGGAGDDDAASSTRRTITHSSASRYSPLTLQLYRLTFPTSPTASSTSPSSSSPPKLTFVRMLHGHIGPVSALSLADGRCVSLGVNGRIWVWDLEGGEGASFGVEVDQSNSGDVKEEKSAQRGEDAAVLVAAKGAVAFDERRIVSAGLRGIEARRFDV